MDIPIWAWDEKENKYVVFPTHLLETFPDGKVGISFPTWAEREKTYAVEHFAKYFKLAPVDIDFHGNGFRYVYVPASPRKQLRKHKEKS